MFAAVPRSRHRAAIALCGVVAGVTTAALGGLVLLTLLDALGGSGSCAPPVQAGGLRTSATGVLVGASEYGGPGDRSSGVIGASGANLLEFPDSYAELGGDTFQTATAMGGLPYGAPLRIAWGTHAAIAYKRDFGLGGGPVNGLPRVIDLWWQFAGRLGIPYEGGLWSGPVRIDRPPDTGAGAVLGASGLGGSSTPNAVDCADPMLASGVLVTPGDHARLLPNGLAAAPADAPAAVRSIIAAGNQIAGRPYVYGAAHGLPLSDVAPAYDCSSSVEHLLYGARLFPVTYAAPSSTLGSFGAPGPGRWVTLYANPAHVFMYVAGLRWDTHDAAGAGDGSSGIGWHPLVRDAAGFVARHPVGL
jgi:hypothetical protein